MDRADNGRLTQSQYNISLKKCDEPYYREDDQNHLRQSTGIRRTDCENARSDIVSKLCWTKWNDVLEASGYDKSKPHGRKAVNFTGGINVYKYMFEHLVRPDL